MNLQDLTKQFTKKNIPEIRPGETVRISYKITEGSKTRVQAFEGLVIAAKHGQGLDGSIKVRKVSGGVGVERTFALHSPLIVKFEKLKTSNPKRSKLYFVRDLTGKQQKRKKKAEKKDYVLWEESAGEEELAKIEAEKAHEAELKAQEEAQEQQELEEKFQEAQEAREEKV